VAEDLEFARAAQLEADLYSGDSIAGLWALPLFFLSMPPRSPPSLQQIRMNHFGSSEGLGPNGNLLSVSPIDPKFFGRVRASRTDSGEGAMQSLLLGFVCVVSCWPSAVMWYFAPPAASLLLTTWVEALAIVTACGVLTAGTACVSSWAFSLPPRANP
jgi:hypothetical protein